MQGCSLRFGHVTEYDPSRHTARVNFPDIGLTSWWLPVLVSNSLKNHDEVHLDVGEHVACLMAGEMGVILGAFYDDKNPPAVKDSDTRAVTFSDGAQILYSRKDHALTAEIPECVSVSTKSITNSAEAITNSAESFSVSAESISMTGGSGGSAGLSGKTIDITGEVITLSGNINLTGNITLSGSVSCPGWCVDK